LCIDRLERSILRSRSFLRCIRTREQIRVADLTISLSFGFILFLFLVIGLSSKFKAQPSSEDYYLAGRNVSPFMVGLSAAASWCSGFVFIGQIGFTYTRGLSSIWIMLGLILGDLFIALISFRRFRIQTGQRGQQSYFEGLFNLSDGRKSKIEMLLFWAVCAIALVALIGYSGAQLLASGKAFEAVYSLPLELGVIVTVVPLAVYCFAGGVRASIWTDVAQASIMLAAMMILFVQSLQALGGVDSFVSRLYELPPAFTSIYPPDIVEQSPQFLLLVFLAGLEGVSVLVASHTLWFDLWP
jgi:sodium/proline symporter